MIPLRLVIDTNVVVSAALKPEGLQRTVVLLAMAKPLHWYVSTPILSEYALVLACLIHEGWDFGWREYWSEEIARSEE